MTTFEYIAVLLSVIVGLGLTHLLGAVARLIHHPGRYKLYWIHLFWAWYVFVYLLYFWFSGCPPCVKISPHLVQLQENFGNKDFSIIAVNADRYLELDTSDEDRAAYVKKVGFTFPLGHLNPNIMQAYGNISVYPTLFLVADGVIQKQYMNYQPYEVLAKDVATLLE